MNKHVVFNAVMFQGNWFAVILSAATGRPWIGLLTTAGFIAVHLSLHGRVARTLALIVGCGIFGYVADSALVLAGALGFPPEAMLGGPSALWMVALWAGLACTLHHSMGWLRGRPLLGAIFGLLGGAGSYYAGERLGAVTFPGGLAKGLIGSGVLWAVAMPLLAWVAGRVLPDGTPAESPATSPAESPAESPAASPATSPATSPAKPNAASEPAP
ncbi:MAG: DUF2878 family protein [Phycisphaerales bacterium]